METKHYKIINFENILQIVEVLKGQDLRNKKIIIGIDGFAGAGKTTLAKDLRDSLGINSINVIDIDDGEYYPRGKGGIIEYIDFTKLKKDITNSQISVCFVSVCLLQIFEKIKIIPDIHIYIKKMAARIGSAPDLWRDENDCTFEADNQWAKTLKKEDVQYHQRYKPHEKADYCYLRFEKE